LYSGKELREVFYADERFGMLGAKNPFSCLQRTPKERLGLSIAALVLKKLREIVQTCEGLWMLGAENPLKARECALV